MPDIFTVIADPTRRRVLGALLAVSAEPGPAGERTVGALVEELGVTQPTVTKHLRVLRECGLVVTREAGQQRFHRLDPEPLLAVEDWIVPFLGAADDHGPATTSWTPDGQPVSVRRGSGADRPVLAVGAELGRVMAEASFRATSALTGAQTGWGRVVEPVRRRLTRRSDGDGE